MRCSHSGDLLETKSRIHWLHEGNANTKFFHAMERSRVVASTMDTIRDGRRVDFNGQEEVHLATIDYFGRFLTSEPHVVDEEPLNLISDMVTKEDNQTLMNPFSLEETRAAMASIPLDSALGLDEFTVAFFSQCWEIVKVDVFVVINKMRTAGSLPRYWTHAAIILIPKKTALETFADFRPISLCPTIYKILAKLIDNRLALLLPKLILSN